MNNTRWRDAGGEDAMGEVAWTTRRPGDGSAPFSTAEVIDQDGAILMGDLRIPQWARIPEDSPIGAGEQRRVVAHGYHGCPQHEPETWREPGTVLHLQLEGDIFVAECVRCGFVVFSF